MSVLTWLQGLLRHTGYALLLVGASLITVERLAPGFSTPYLNIYLFIPLGLAAGFVGGWNVQGHAWTKGVVGVGIGGLLLVFLYSGLAPGISTSVLFISVTALLIAFLVQSLYARDL